MFYIFVFRLTTNLYIPETNFRKSTQIRLYTRRFVSLYSFQKYKLILMKHYNFFQSVITFLLELTFNQKRLWKSSYYVSIKILQKRLIQITQSHISLGRLHLVYVRQSLIQLRLYHHFAFE